MHRVGPYILGLLFSGGTALAAGSVLSALKRSMSDPTRIYHPGPTIGLKGTLLDAENERKENPVPTLLALAPPQNQSVEILQTPQSHEADNSRPGANRKKRGRLGPAKGRKEKSAATSRAASRPKRRSQP